jgi:dihydrofolate reductase
VPTLVLVAALAARNRVIGRGDQLPWHIPADLKHFKRLTLGETLLVGRHTYESILAQFGGPLPGREMVVLSRRGSLPDAPGVPVYASIDAALEALSGLDQVVVAGGGEVYAQTVERADRLELTLVGGRHEGDAFFPPFRHLVGPVFRETWSEGHLAEGGRPAFRFVRYERIPERRG